VKEFDAAARRAAEELAAEGARIAEEAGFEPQPIAIEAPDGVWRPLLELAEERQARAVIVGSHGRSRAGAALLGSVSRAIANRSKRPVIVVPG
jgi:nucleotide-binding universal stress UspA family protein